MKIGKLSNEIIREVTIFRVNFWSFRVCENDEGKDQSQICCLKMKFLKKFEDNIKNRMTFFFFFLYSPSFWVRWIKQYPSVIALKVFGFYFKCGDSVGYNKKNEEIIRRKYLVRKYLIAIFKEDFNFVFIFLHSQAAYCLKSLKIRITNNATLRLHRGKIPSWISLIRCGKIGLFGECATWVKASLIL